MPSILNSPWQLWEYLFLSTYQTIRNKKIPSSNCLIIKVKPMISCPLLQPAADTFPWNIVQKMWESARLLACIPLLDLLTPTSLLQSGPEKLVSWSWHLHCQILRTLLLLDLNIENSLLQHNQVELKISTFCHLLLAIGTRKKIEYWYFLIFCSPTIWLGQNPPS